MAGACRAQGKLIATSVGARRPVAVATAPSTAARRVTVAAPTASPAARGDAPAPPAALALPSVDDLGWFGGPAVAAEIGGGAAGGGPWLAAAVAVSLLALVGLVGLLARTPARHPAAGRAGPRGLRSIIDSTRAARSELGEALPALLFLGMLGGAIVFWVWVLMR